MRFLPNDRPLQNLALFLMTALSVTWVYFAAWTVESHDKFDRLADACFFSFSVLLILGAHEMGHYLLARHHDVETSLPWFIPVPMGFGTMGAVIRLRGKIPSRNALVDIGAAGPLAGLLIAIPLVVVGTLYSRVVDAPANPPILPGSMSLLTLGAELFTLVRDQLTGQVTPAAAQAPYIFFGDSLLTSGVRHALLGAMPEGKNIVEHPVLIAAWFGTLVTMLNLMPIGQLDGGHLTHAWFGGRAERIGRAGAVLLALLTTFCSVSWLLWLVLTVKVLGFKHPPVTAPDEPLSRGRKFVCAVCFVFFGLTLIPVPLGVL